MALSVAKKKKFVAGVSITSLMDVLTIILIFLLVNYSEEEQKKDPPKFITLPSVMASGVPKKSDNVESTAEVVLGRGIASVNERKFRFRSIKQLVASLGPAFQRAKASRPKPKKGYSVVIAADKTVPYQFVDAVLVTAAHHGISTVEFQALRKQE